MWVNVAFAALNGAGGSLTQGALFSNFVVRQPNQKDVDVGLLFATGGIVMIMLAWPLGFLADKMKRTRILMLGCAVGLASAAIFAAALLVRSIPLLYAASALTGAFTAMSGPALAASFADSLETGERTRWMTVWYASGCVAGAAGPGAAAVAFLLWGNDWDEDKLVVMMLAGNAVNVLAALSVLLIKDDDLGVASEGALGSTDARFTSLEYDGVVAVEGAIADGSVNGGGGGESLGASLISKGAASAAVRHGLGHQTVNIPCFKAPLTVAAIPYLIFGADFIIACGAGMTVAFFPLFFSEEYSLSPAATAAVFAVSPILIACMGVVGMPLARRLGRATTSTTLGSLGTLCIFVLAIPGIHVAVAIFVYLVRTALMNGCYAINRSILMDVVAKKERGRWSSLENLTAFTWTGSAVLGGLLVDKFSFRFTFLVTACIYVAGVSVRSLVIPLTRGEVVDEKN